MKRVFDCDAKVELADDQFVRTSQKNNLKPFFLNLEQPEHIASSQELFRINQSLITYMKY